MTLLYVLIGLAVVYAAYYFGAKKKANQAQLANQINQPLPGKTHAHDSLDSSHVRDASEETHKQHKGHGCC